MTKLFCTTIVMASTLWPALCAPAQDRVPPAQPEARAQEAAAAKRAPRISGEARDALAAAAMAARQAKGLRGPERLQVLEMAAGRYEAVAAEFAAERPACAQASYEAGELWRRHGSLAKAEAAYRKALASDDGRFEERALYQIAEMQRRQKMLDAAIETYRRAAGVKPSSGRAHDARLWVGRCLLSQSKDAAAIEAFQQALESTDEPRQVIEACNDLAKAFIRTGDLTAAEGAIEHARTAARPVIEAGGDDAPGLQKALDGMSAQKALERARDKANATAKDAVQLERDRK